MLRKKSMKWIFLFTLASYLLVNSPLFYSLIYVHRLQGVGSLWGYAPNQFFFLVIVFPFAAFAAFTSLYLFVDHLYPILPTSFRFKWLFDNWPVGFLVAVILSALITIIIYLTTGWSFDKLQPVYASKALDSVKTFETEVEKSSLKKEEQESFRKKKITEAKQIVAGLQIPEDTDTGALNLFFDGLGSAAFLQVIQTPGLVAKLRLLNPVIHLLNVFQLFIVLLIGLCVLFIAASTIAAGIQFKYDGIYYPQLGEPLNAIFWTVFFFGLYSICYYQYRSQIEEVVGPGTTVLQDFFIGLVTFIILVAIRLLDSNNQEVTQQVIFSYLPIVVLVILGLAGIFKPEFSKTLIGSETNLGIQLILTIIFVFFSCFPLFRMLSRVHD